MFNESTSQGSLFESSYQMSERKQRRLAKTWGLDYRTHCQPMIAEEIFRPLYCEDNGAPCKSIRLVVGVLLLQAMFDLTDEETQHHVDFDLRWHLALGLDPCEDGDYVSQRTLQYFRVRLAAYPVIGLFFDHLLDRQIALLGTRTGWQRQDSTQIRSNFARLSRLGVFCETQRVLLKALRREAPVLLETLPVSLRRRYLREDGCDSSYDDARASDSRCRLDVAARDAYRLRAGIEGTNSELKRGHGLGALRVRGGKRVENAVGFRVMACNLKRMLKHLVNTRRKANKSTLMSVFTLVSSLKSAWLVWWPPYVVCRAVA